MRKREWFSYGPNSGFNFHDSAKKAKDYAESDLEAYRDEAGDGWSDEVDQVCWGEVKGQVVESERLNREEAIEQGRPWRDEWDEFVDYKLEDIAVDGVTNEMA